MFEIQFGVKWPEKGWYAGKQNQPTNQSATPQVKQTRGNKLEGSVERRKTKKISRQDKTIKTGHSKTKKQTYKCKKREMQERIKTTGVQGNNTISVQNTGKREQNRKAEPYKQHVKWIRMFQRGSEVKIYLYLLRAVHK